MSVPHFFLLQCFLVHVLKISALTLTILLAMPKMWTTPDLFSLSTFSVQPLNRPLYIPRQRNRSTEVGDSKVGFPAD